jgi:hypothetical protein
LTKRRLGFLLPVKRLISRSVAVPLVPISPPPIAAIAQGIAFIIRKGESCRYYGLIRKDQEGSLTQAITGAVGGDDAIRKSSERIVSFFYVGKAEAIARNQNH